MATVEFEKVEQGVAYNFRKTINDNFSKTAEAIEDLVEQIENATGIDISATEPTTPKVGGFWFKIL